MQSVGYGSLKDGSLDWFFERNPTHYMNQFSDKAQLKMAVMCGWWQQK
jgi:hypothetical protein